MKIQSSPKYLLIEQPEKFEYRAAWNLWISSNSKTLNIETFEYRAAWKVRISSRPKSLNIERHGNFEHRAPRKMKIQSRPKTLNIEQPTKSENRVERKLWISSSLESLNIERPEKFEYRAIRQPCCKTNFYKKQLRTKRWPRIAKAQNQYWFYHPQVSFIGVTFPLPN